MFHKTVVTINEQVTIKLPDDIQLYIKREDQIHPFISGNKYRKLKYNIIAARYQGYDQFLTFGGAYSNHIAAVAAAGKEFGFTSIGIIRGEEVAAVAYKNATLRYARSCGMVLKYISRNAYRHKTSPWFLKTLKEEFGAFYLLPEGGTNTLAVQGCEEILTEADRSYDVVCCPVGTGGTLCGIINSADERQHILGFSVLKGHFINDDIRKFARKNNWRLIPDYHFGGYGKVTPALIAFINTFKEQTGIPLDPVYTGKMLYGIIDLVKKKYVKKHAKLLAIHTGGLQGITGMNAKLKKQQLSQII